MKETLTSTRLNKQLNMEKKSQNTQPINLIKVICICLFSIQDSAYALQWSTAECKVITAYEPSLIIFEKDFKTRLKK